MNQELKDILLELGVFKRVDIPSEQIEQIKPEELRIDFNGRPYVIHDAGLTTEEVNTFLNAQQTMQIKIIKNVVLIYFIFSLLVAILFFFGS